MINFVTGIGWPPAGRDVLLQERNLSSPSHLPSMSTKAKLIGVLVVAVLAYALFSGDTEPVEVQVEE